MVDDGLANQGYLPSRYAIVVGFGHGSTELNAFDAALHDAGVGDYNLVRVSSILPPACAASPVIDLPSGSILHIAYAFRIADGADSRVSSAVAIGIPSDDGKPGVIMERSSDADAASAEECAKRMAEEAMRLRGNKSYEIKSASAQCGSEGGYCCTFAGVALW